MSSLREILIGLKLTWLDIVYTILTLIIVFCFLLIVWLCSEKWLKNCNNMAIQSEIFLRWWSVLLLKQNHYLVTHRKEMKQNLLWWHLYVHHWLGVYYTTSLWINLSVACLYDTPVVQQQWKPHMSDCHFNECIISMCDTNSDRIKCWLLGLAIMNVISWGMPVLVNCHRGVVKMKMWQPYMEPVFTITQSLFLAYAPLWLWIGPTSQYKGRWRKCCSYWHNITMRGFIKCISMTL